MRAIKHIVRVRGACFNGDCDCMQYDYETVQFEEITFACGVFEHKKACHPPFHDGCTCAVELEKVDKHAHPS